MRPCLDACRYLCRCASLWMSVGMDGFTCLRVQLCLCGGMAECVYIDTHVYIYMHTYIHIYSHTYTDV